MEIVQLTSKGRTTREHPHVNTDAEQRGKDEAEKTKKQEKDAHLQGLVNHLQKVADGKQEMDAKKLASAVLLALGYESESQASEFAKNKI